MRELFENKESIADKSTDVLESPPNKIVTTAKHVGTKALKYGAIGGGIVGVVALGLGAAALAAGTVATGGLLPAVATTLAAVIPGSTALAAGGAASVIGTTMLYGGGVAAALGAVVGLAGAGEAQEVAMEKYQDKQDRLQSLQDRREAIQHRREMLAMNMGGGSPAPYPGNLPGRGQGAGQQLS